jgi:hypothetical protein
MRAADPGRIGGRRTLRPIYRCARKEEPFALMVVPDTATRQRINGAGEVLTIGPAIGLIIAPTYELEIRRILTANNTDAYVLVA